MISATIIDVDNEIVSVVSAPDEPTLALNTPAGCIAIESVPADHNSYWNPAIAQWIPKGSPPNSYDTWDTTTKAWVDMRSLPQQQDDQWALIKAARDAVVYGGFVWDGSQFESDNVSQQRIQGAVQLALMAQSAAQPYSVSWGLADNTVRVLSGSDTIAVGMALGALVQTATATGQTLRAAIYAATTSAAVAAITWPAS